MLACFLVACGGEVASHLNQGDELLFAQKFARAEAAYRKALKRLDDEATGRAKSKDARRALERLGRINTLYLHNYPQAIEDLQRIVADFPGTAEAYTAQTLLGEIRYYRQNDLSAAVVEYTKLVNDWAAEPQVAGAQAVLAEILFKLKNYEQATKEAQALIDKWPDAREVPKARFTIANIQYTEGQFKEALANYEKLVADFPDSDIVPLAKFEMANCKQELGANQEAMALLKDTLQQHPNPRLVQRKMVRIQRRVDQTAPAKIITDTKGTPYMPKAKTKAAAPAPQDAVEREVAPPPTPPASDTANAE